MTVVMVTGSRDIVTPQQKRMVWGALDSLAPSCVIHGDANGADQTAGYWAAMRNVEMKVFPADWYAHGKAAGPIRNRKMIDESKPDLVLAFPLHWSIGTHHAIDYALSKGIPVRIYVRDDD